ncbi:hypothetical protein [Pedobacter sp. L105]|uniref:hypothetical protein n=1 Tax=Pedobacter sp. L105 TaxID=1641871 RepID=UPI00131BF063|nr:hypothetical protein [Pedobacter sp. L105]
MTFCYVTAKGTDNTEQGKTMWARVKGKTENELANMGFQFFFAFRPFMLTPTKGLLHTHSFYNIYQLVVPDWKAGLPRRILHLKRTCPINDQGRLSGI